MKKLLCFIAFVLVKLILCVVLIISSLHIQAQEMSIRIYTAKDGLPSTYVYGAYQDKLGYLWVGSPDGLSRFDGKYFTNYSLTDGLPDTRAVGSFMDSRLRYWIATPRGVVEFKGNRFISYPLSDSQNIRWVSQITETKDGHIRCFTNVGVYQFTTDKWKKINLYPGYENHNCTTIIETKDGSYINYADLLVLRRPDETYKIIGKLKDVGYYNTLSISTGQVFISTLDGIYEIKNQQLIKLPGVLGRLKGLYTYFCDSKKRFWIGTNTKGLQLLAADDTTHLIPVYKGSKDFLIQGISEDNDGSIWVGTGNGLFKISETGFKIFPTEAMRGNGILRNVMQPPTGPLLINNGTFTLHTFENGLFSKKQLKRKNITHFTTNEMIIDNYAFDNKNRYWYYLRGFALAMQDGKNVYEQTKNLAPLGDQVFDVLFDTYRKKIIVAVRTQKYPCVFNDTSYSILPVANNIEVTGNIMRLHQCLNGIILFATDQGLIYSLDTRNICKLQLNEFRTEGIISKFYNDPSSGDVWIIYSGRGLRRYHWQNDSLIFKEQINKTNGLPTDNVSSLCFDNRDNFWVCNNSNITVFSKEHNHLNNQNYKVVSFFNADDLQLEDSYNSRLVKDSRGNIWLFSDRHLICFYPDKINYNPALPSVQIENIELNLQQTNWAGYADSLSGIFQLPNHPNLSHENNTLGFYFKGISSSGTDGIKYSYQLKGLQNLWSIPSSNDFISFVKLPPGKYIFKVKAQLPNTNWSEPAMFSFEIKKAFWQTWWFYILAWVVLLTAIYLLFRYRLRQKINILDMRNRFSQDLHDEIGASISGINLLSQIAAEKLQNNKPDEASEYLFKVKNYTQDVIEKLSDMVWIFNPRNDSIEKLLQRLKSYSLSVALSKNIKMHFDTDKETEVINLSIRQRKAIYLISKEAINNAFKYAGCSNIYYTLYCNASKCDLRIEDDGQGFNVTENMNGNGLKNMRARADEIAAKLNVQSKQSTGTIITLKL